MKSKDLWRFVLFKIKHRKRSVQRGILHKTRCKNNLDSGKNVEGSAALRLGNTTARFTYQRPCSPANFYGSNSLQV